MFASKTSYDGPPGLFHKTMWRPNRAKTALRRAARLAAPACATSRDAAHPHPPATCIGARTAPPHRPLPAVLVPPPPPPVAGGCRRCGASRPRPACSAPFPPSRWYGPATAGVCAARRRPRGHLVRPAVVICMWDRAGARPDWRGGVAPSGGGGPAVVRAPPRAGWGRPPGTPRGGATAAAAAAAAAMRVGSRRA